jgi:hypothetical protein
VICKSIAPDFIFLSSEIVFLTFIFNKLKSMKRILFLLLVLPASTCVINANITNTINVVSDTTHKAYVGVYKLDAQGFIDTYTVTYEDDKLYGQANGYDKTELKKEDAPHSFVSGYGSTVIFMQEEADKPFTKVKLVIQGNDVFGVKQ